MTQTFLVPFIVGEQIQLQVKQCAERFTTTFIGLEHGKYLIVKIPAVPTADIKSVFASGKSIVMRYIHQGTVLGFSSVVIGTVLVPEKLLFIQYPKSVEEHNLRKHSRILCNLPAEVMINTKTITGFVLDLSKKGCRFSFIITTNTPLDSIDLKCDILIFFALPGVERKFEIFGTIRNLHKDEDIWSFGIQFNNIAESVEKKLYQYLDEASTILWDNHG